MRNGILLFFLLVLGVLACSKEVVEEFDYSNCAMVYGADGISKLDGNFFAKGDSVGVFAYYNYYFGGSNVVLTNEKFTVDGPCSVLTSGSTIYWSFGSSADGAYSQPTVMLNFAYYPYTTSVTSSEIDGKGSCVTFDYDVTNLDSHRDLMVASTNYTASSDGSAFTFDSFSSYVLGLEYIPFVFNRTMARVSLNQKCTSESQRIKIVGVEINVDSYTKYTAAMNDSYIGNYYWHTMAAGKTLSIVADSIKNIDSGTVDSYYNILKCELYFPPAKVVYSGTDDNVVKTVDGTDIHSIKFLLSVDTTGDGGFDTTGCYYEWSPNLETIAANTPYDLNFEIYTDRIYDSSGGAVVLSGV